MSEGCCEVCGRPDGAGHETYCDPTSDWLMENNRAFHSSGEHRPDPFDKIPSQQHDHLPYIALGPLDLMSPADIIKTEVALLVKAAEKNRIGIPVGWSAIGAEYRIRMALNQLTHKEK